MLFFLPLGPQMKLRLQDSAHTSVEPIKKTLSPSTYQKPHTRTHTHTVLPAYLSGGSSITSLPRALPCPLFAYLLPRWAGSTNVRTEPTQRSSSLSWLLSQCLAPSRSFIMWKESRFSPASKCAKCVSHSVVSDSATPCTVARQAPLSMGFSRQEHWSGLPCPPPGDLPDTGSNLGILHCRQILSSEARAQILPCPCLPRHPTGKISATAELHILYGL